MMNEQQMLDAQVRHWEAEGQWLPGFSSMFARGAVRCDVADLDGDGKNELITASDEGVQIRSGGDLRKVQTDLAVTHVHWVTACDLDGDRRKDLVVSRHNRPHRWTD